MAQPPAILTNNRGQSLIESLALALVVPMALWALGAVFYFGFVDVGMNYLLHEYLVCNATAGAVNCEKDLRQKADVILFAGKLVALESHGRIGSHRVKAVVRMPMERTLTFKKELEI